MTIEQLEALEKAATAGPWRWSDQFKTRDNDETWSLLGVSGYGILSCDGFGNSPQMCNKHDAELIVEMRESLPHLLAVAKAAKAVARWTEQEPYGTIKMRDDTCANNALAELCEALSRLEAQ